MINQAVILAGGMGKRLFPLTKNLPILALLYALYATDQTE